MTGEDYKRIGMGDYLDILQLWCIKEYPFSHNEAYKKLRDGALYKARYMIEHGEAEETVSNLLKEKTRRLVAEGLKYEPTSLFF